MNMHMSTDIDKYELTRKIFTGLWNEAMFAEIPF